MVVQVPLEDVEGGPDPLADLFPVGEGARMLVGEDLPQRALVGVGHGAVGEEEVVVGVLGIAGQRALRPAVLVRGVVEDEIQHQADARGAQLVAKLAQVVHRAEARFHGAVVAHGIAAVVVALRSFEQGHQVEIGEAKFLEVRNLGAEPVEVAREQIDIIHAAQHGLRLEPGGVRLALSVQLLQLGWPVQPGLGGHGQDALQLVKEIILLPVEGE